METPDKESADTVDIDALENDPVCQRLERIERLLERAVDCLEAPMRYEKAVALAVSNAKAVHFPGDPDFPKQFLT